MGGPKGSLPKLTDDQEKQFASITGFSDWLKNLPKDEAELKQLDAAQRQRLQEEEAERIRQQKLRDANQTTGLTGTTTGGKPTGTGKSKGLGYWWILIGLLIAAAIGAGVGSSSSEMTLPRMKNWSHLELKFDQSLP